MSFVSLSLEKVPEMKRIGRFTSNDFSCWGMEVHNLEIWTSSQPDIFLPRDKNSHRGVKDWGWVEAIELVWETAKKKNHDRVISLTLYGPARECSYQRTDLLSCKGDPLIMSYTGPGWRVVTEGLMQGEKGQTLGILKRLMSWQKTKLDYI